jgi:septum formation protein
MIYLASNSPRRAELLKQIAIPFTRISGDVEELLEVGESATDYVQRLALQKAQQGLYNVVKNKLESAPVLGSDTIVVLGQHIFEKPKDQNEARNMMLMLSGNTHHVYTAIALVSSEEIKTALVTSKVTFKKLSENEISDYWETGEPKGKAGGYGIQGEAGKFITHLEGSYSAVMGLPLFETSELITHFKEKTCL